MFDRIRERSVVDGGTTMINLIIWLVAGGVIGWLAS